MRYLIFSDVHCCERTPYSKPTPDGLTTHLHRVRDSVRWVIEQAQEHQVDSVVFLGDWWDSPRTISGSAFAVTMELWREFAEVPVRKIALVGNHDYWDIEHNVHLLKVMGDFGWVVVDWVGKAWGDWDIGWLPYRDDYNADEVKDVLMAKLVFAHADIMGCTLWTGHKTQGISVANSGATIFNGHYHNPADEDHVCIVGSLLEKDFSDLGAPKGIVIYDDTRETIERIVNPHSQRFEVIQLDSRAVYFEQLERILDNSVVRVEYATGLEKEARIIEKLASGGKRLPIQAENASVQTSYDDVSLQAALDDYLSGKDPEIVLNAKRIYEAGTREDTSHGVRRYVYVREMEIFNFQSVHRATIRFDHRGPQLIRGINEDYPDKAESNGAGKSSIIEALYWAFTGKSLRGSLVGDLIRRGQKELVVKVRCTIDNKDYAIIRSRGSKEYANLQIEDFSGEKLQVRGTEDSQVRLTSLIGDSKLLKYLAFLTADLQSSRYSALTQDARARLLEDLVDLTAYTAAQEVAKKEVARAKVNVDEAVGAMRALEAQKDAAGGEVESYAKEYTALVESGRRAAKDSQEVISASKGKLFNFDAQREEILKDIENQGRRESALMSKARTFNTQLEEAQAILLSVSGEYSVADANVMRFQALYKKSLCPECEQRIVKSEIKSKIQHHALKKRELSEKKIVAENQVAKMSKKLACCYDQAEKIRGVRRASEQTLVRLQKQRDAVSKELEQAKHIQDQLHAEEERVEALLTAKRRDVIRLSKETMDAREAHMEAVRSLAMLKTIQHEIFDEQGIRKHFLSTQAIPYLNVLVAQYAEQLCGYSVGIGVNFDLVLEGGQDYRTLSSGERKRVDLSIQFALSDLAGKYGCLDPSWLCVDEVLDEIDQAGLHAVAELLAGIKKTILVVSHNPILANLISRQLVVYKRGGVTTVEEL
jgi:recombinational DNA repair ATPase RecF